MILSLLGFASGIFSPWIVWLLADGLRRLSVRRRAEARQRAGLTPLRLSVMARTNHTDNLFSLTLALPNGKCLPRFQPGQFLAVRLPSEAVSNPTTRLYSLAAWTALLREYRLGIRRVTGGQVSGWLHTHAWPGIALEVLPPAGEFVLATPTGEVVLVGGGIGLTVREAAELVDNKRYSELQIATHWFRYRPFLSRPGADWNGGHGRLTAADLTRELADPARATYYLCARAEMMDGLAAGLIELGVPASAIQRESFGGVGGNADDNEYLVDIAEHGSHRFRGEPSLLHALEAWRVPVPADCRSVESGARRVRIEHGTLRPCQPAQTTVPAAYALACCTRPESDLKLSLQAK